MDTVTYLIMNYHFLKHSFLSRLHSYLIAMSYLSFSIYFFLPLPRSCYFCSHVTLSSGVIIQFRVRFYCKETFAGKQKKIPCSYMWEKFIILIYYSYTHSGWGDSFDRHIQLATARLVNSCTYSKSKRRDV